MCKNIGKSSKSEQITILGELKVMCVISIQSAHAFLKIDLRPF